MGDIFPYGAAAYVTWQAAFNWFTNNGFTDDDAAIFAAIGTAESSLDYRIINDTPSTGDYSVGIWQINYYGSLNAERTKQFGTPKQLVQGGLDAQAQAAHYLWSQSGGWTPWSTYNNGAYKAYLHGYAGGGTTSTSGEPTIQQGASGSAVTTLQTDLNHLGYNLAVDGSFGPATKAAVVDFQGKHGLSKDGIVGPLTWAAISKALGAAQTPSQPTGPAPPSEPPGHVDGGTLNSWSSLGATVSNQSASFIKTVTSAVNGYKEI